MDEIDSVIVKFGTPLEPLEEDEIPKKRPIRIEDQVATDDQGRRRFHGAFTGGFSAGYFNTVGTKEGWAPSTFISSRKSKADSFQQSALDIMDDEDKSVHGISHQAVRVTSHYDNESFGNRKRAAEASIRDGPIPGEAPLSSLITSSSETIGTTLLKKMGWKPGQGIGPRLKYKDKKKKSKSRENYEARDNSSSDDDNNDKASAYNRHTFAPEDTDCLPYTPKDNFFGLGYQGLDRSSLSSGHINLFESTTTATATMKNKARLKIRGQAFGVGAFEDDDEDIYAKDDMARYDFTLGSEVKTQKKKQLAITSSKTIPGFHVSSKKLGFTKFYRPPELPKTFRPYHTSDEINVELANQEQPKIALTARERSAVVGDEDSKAVSVFDFVSPQDRDRLLAVKSGKPVPENKPPSEDAREKSDEVKSSNVEVVERQKSHFPLILGRSINFSSSDFKPFARDEAKQSRYDKFLELAKSGNKEELSSIQPSSMTEWERARELDEFQRAANMYRPLSSIMATRFTAAKHQDDDSKIDISIDKIDDRSDDLKAADMKMFGQMTRKSFEWHPDKVLCKRFNVKNPYPGCEIVGMPKVQREKASLFNFLNDADGSRFGGREIPEPSETQISENKSVAVSVKLEDAAPLKKASAITYNDDDEEKENERPTIDIFKAIFASDESDDDSDDDDDEEEEATEEESRIDASKILQAPTKPKLNEKAASGVFANIDFDSVNKAPKHMQINQPIIKDSEPEKFSVKLPTPPPVLYGPALPPPNNDNPARTSKKKKKEKKKKKKSKQKLKKDHKKKKSKHKRRDSSSSDENSSEDASLSDISQLSDKDIANRLKKLGGNLKKYL